MFKIIQMKRQIYPLIYKWAYSKGRESDFVPMDKQKEIPKQTKFYWRNLGKDKTIKLELSIEALCQYSNINKNNEVKSEWYKKRFFISMTKFHQNLMDLMGREKYISYLFKSKTDFVKLIEKFSKTLPKKEILKWFQISNNQYQLWYTQVFFECESSKLKLCAKQHPFQITNKEYLIIELALTDPYYHHWPKSAIHSELLRRKKLNISKSTFYKYANRINPHDKRSKKKPSFKPLRAKYVNEYWHQDLSYFKTLDGGQSYIYAIIDNFSRKIISWKCTRSISRITTGEVISEAMEKVSLFKLNLVTDSGTENINQYIENLLSQYHEQHNIKIIHEIALKTIQQSNSMIERFFRTMKSCYLYFDIPVSHEELCIALEKIIHEYNCIRPHHALTHRTPDEVFKGKPIEDRRDQMKKAQKMRFNNNKNCDCLVCIC